MRKPVLLLLILTFIFVSSAYAQAEEELSVQSEEQSEEQSEAENNVKKDVTLKPCIVEAARSKTDYKKLPASVDVITSEDLEKKAKVDNFYDAIKNAPGVHADHGGGMGWPTITIRGQTPAVLLDGLSIDPYITGSPFNILTAGTGAVERIEILKGAVAATQGSGAMSGAINVVMKRGDADHPYVKVDLGAGENETRNGSFTISGGKDKFAWFANYTQKHTDDYETPNGKIPYTDSRYKNLYARLDCDITKKQNVSLETIYNEGRYRTGGQGFYYVNDGSSNKIWENEPETTALYAKYDGDFDWFDIKATLGYVDNTLEEVYGNAPYDVASFKKKVNTAKMEEEVYLGDIRSRIDVLDDELLTAHLNYSHKTTEADSYGKGALAIDYSSTNHQNSFVGQMESKPIPYLLLLAGIRYDGYERDGENTDHTGINYGASIYPFADTDYNWTTLWASYNEAFKIPSSNYLYMAGVGNPDLKNEESEGWEVGVKQDFSHWASLSLSYFETDYKNRIVFDLTAFKMNNIGCSRTRGIEGQFSVYPTDFLTLYTNYLRMQRTDRTTNDGLYSSVTPDTKLAFGALINNFYNFSLAVEGSWYVAYKLSDGSQHPSQGKVVLDTKLSYKMHYDQFTIEPYVSVTNLTDQLLYSAGDTAGIQPGRTVLCGVGVQYDF